MAQETQTEHRAEQGAASGIGRSGVRGRALLIGALGVAATAVLVTQAEMVLSSLRIGYLQFPPVALGLLLAAVALGRGLKRLRARWGLSSADLIVIYCMLLVSAMTSTHGVVQKWIPLLVAPGYFANQSNNWRTLFWGHLPQQFFPFDLHGTPDQRVLKEYFEKTPRGLEIPWQAWVGPVLCGAALILLVLFAFLCLTAILRRQWVDNEKLSFPLAQLPLEIAADEDGGRGFFANRLLWLGALLPVVVYVIKGLHQVQPTVPDITLSITVNDYLTSPPWNRLAYTQLVLSFAAVGFFFLLPTDVLFSIWFFFLLSRVEQLILISYNMDTPGMPLYPPPLFIGYQTVGAYLVLTGYFVWIARPHLRRVWAAATGRGSVDDSDELLPYRFAVWGLFGSIAATALWLSLLGMSPWLAVFEMAVFLFVIAVVMARSTAEAGMLMTETTFRPIDLYRMVAPIHDLGPTNLTLLAFFDNLFLRDQRGLLLTGFLDGARLSDGAPRVRRRAFAGVFALGVLLAMALAVVLNIYLPYHLGAGSMDNWMEQGSTQLTWTDYAPFFLPGPNLQGSSSWQMPTFFGVGVVVTVFLTVMRTAFFWWPLHPLGYALSGSWSTVEFWFPCLIAWILKALILRYGGMSTYAKARPFFLGLVLGEFGIAVLYALLNVLSAWLTPEHKIPPPAFPWG